MAMTDKFDLNEFAAHGDEIRQDVSVCIPKTPFQIHPNRSRMMKSVVLKHYENQWFLIHPDVAREGRLSGLWRAALYEGVKSNGVSFVLPLTIARAGREERYDSLKETIREARHGWVLVQSDIDQDSWVTTPQNSKKMQALEPQWFDGEFSTLIEIAFSGRIITTLKEASEIFRKSSKREITEDDD